MFPANFNGLIHCLCVCGNWYIYKNRAQQLDCKILIRMANYDTNIHAYTL
jgi:hypothetical protein